MKFTTAILMSCSLICSELALSQTIPLGPEQSEASGFLEVSDAVLDNSYYYKTIPLTLKAGDGVFLYMIANAYSPRIYTIDTALINWGIGTTTDYIDYSEIAMIFVTARVDTAFNIIYSSGGSSAFMTGEFVYGIRKLSAEQMKYNKSMLFCDRLTYLINNWQCHWGLMPHTSVDDEISTTYNTLYEPGPGRLMNLYTYEETIFSGDTKKAVKKYEEAVAEITACLKPEQWNITTSVDDVLGINTKTTWFTIAGAVIGEHLYTFKIAYDSGGGTEDRVYIKFY